MAAKKEQDAAPKASEKKADDAAKPVEGSKVESPISTTGSVPVYRADLGESLP